MVPTHFTEAVSLNLRSTPKFISSNTNVIWVLPEGQKVEVLEGRPGERFWKVATFINENEVIGYASARYLKEIPSYAYRMFQNLDAIHLAVGNANSSISAKTGLAFPLGDEDKPFRDGDDPATKRAQIGNIIRWLDVENSIRYAPGNQTFCNIYAYDYCYLSRAYLPRVWWTATAVNRLRQQQAVEARYAVTLFEMNANALFHWLEEFGPEFGWKQVFNDLDLVQRKANEGAVCLISAQRKNLNFPGHICMVVPETGEYSARRNRDGKVVTPLQSQAGRHNRQYSSDFLWWAGRNSPYRAFGFWFHD